MDKLEIPLINDFTPLWNNKNVSELSHIPNSEFWSIRGIHYLNHLISDGELKSFNNLQEEFALPNNMFFRYLQIRHALSAQFPETTPQSIPNSIIAVVKSTDPQKLISSFYNMLIIPSSTKLAYNIKSRWEREVGVIEDEEWSEALDNCKVVSPKLSDRLTQIYILHRLYLTPLRIARYKRDHSNSCPMCMQDIGTFFHLIWSCSKIQGFWKQIVEFIHDTMGSPLTLNPKTCLLGIFPDPEIDKFTKIFLQETLFLARRVIARKWMRHTPPTIAEWITDVNGSLPYKKFILH